MTITHTTGDGPFVARRPIYEQVQDWIAARITTGQLTDMLPNEYELARELGVSPGSVRKALQGLQARGLIERRQGRGTYVRKLVTWEEMRAKCPRLFELIGATALSTAEGQQPGIVCGAPNTTDSGAEPADDPAEPKRVLTADDFRALSSEAAVVAGWINRHAVQTSVAG
jgi:DNA-binding transcriptional MocR family regulator